MGGSGPMPSMDARHRLRGGNCSSAAAIARIIHPPGGGAYRIGRQLPLRRYMPRQARRADAALAKQSYCVARLCCTYISHFVRGGFRSILADCSGIHLIDV